MNGHASCSTTCKEDQGGDCYTGRMTADHAPVGKLHGCHGAQAAAADETYTATWHEWDMHVECQQFSAHRKILSIVG